MVVSDLTSFLQSYMETEVLLYRYIACNIAWHEIYLTGWFINWFRRKIEGVSYAHYSWVN
jgi:hypothetical protein